VDEARAIAIARALRGVLEPRPSWADLAIVAEAGGRRRTLLVECKQGTPGAVARKSPEAVEGVQGYGGGRAAPRAQAAA
jgi:hypothetical protein